MEPSELTPAEFEGSPKNRYRPRLPWARIGFVVLGVVLIAAGYFWRQKVRADALRERIERLHAVEVEPVLDALRATAVDLREKSLSARSGAAVRLVDAEAPLSALHDEQIVYLELRAADLRSEPALEAAIETEEHDALGACLGVDLTPLAALSEVPEVLTSDWLAKAHNTDDMRRLSVREEQLARAVERELPRLRQRVPTDYFLLFVIQGKSRLQDPVDVFLWRLADDTLILRSRTENHGRLITVRSQIGPQSEDADAQGDPIAAADCSIAAHIKALLGEPTMRLGVSD